MQRISTIEKEKRILQGTFRFFSLKLLLTSGLFLTVLFVFVIILYGVIYEKKQSFDNTVFHLVSLISSNHLISAMKFFTFFGSANFLVPAYVIMIALFIARKKYRYALHIAIIALSSTMLMFGIKALTHRSRPDLPVIQGITNYSFPSGHTLSAFIFSGIVMYIIWHRIQSLVWKWASSILLLAFSITVGVSRIVLRMHYPTDVIASFCLGIMWSVLSLWLMRRISRKKRLSVTMPS